MPPLPVPALDPTPVFELFRGNHATELLAAAVAHLRVFEKLRDGPLTARDLAAKLGLAERPMTVLATGLRAMNLLAAPVPGYLELTPLAREHLLLGGPFDITEYIGLVADSPGTLALVERLRTNRPAGAAPDEPGAAFIYREGLPSAMEEETAARRLTLALSGRARVCAPVLAARLDLGDAKRLVDVGGGTGLYAIACLERYPKLRAVVWDRPAVLKVAEELAREQGVNSRLECRAGDMFTDRVPRRADVMLLSNVLHDWDVPECRGLVKRLASALPRGGRMAVHDAFLNDALDGPLPVALYSVALFAMTEGRAYSVREYRDWMAEAELTAGEAVPTMVHCGVLVGTKE